MKISKLRRLGLNVVLNAVLNVVPGVGSCSVWHSTRGPMGHILDMDIRYFRATRVGINTAAQ